jgi:hypothetical protein
VIASAASGWRLEQGGAQRMVYLWRAAESEVLDVLAQSNPTSTSL